MYLFWTQYCVKHTCILNPNQNIFYELAGNLHKKLENKINYNVVLDIS